MGIVRTGRNCNNDPPHWGGLSKVGPSLPIGYDRREIGKGCEVCGNKQATLVVHEMLTKARALCPGCIEYYRRVGFIVE